MSERKSFPLSWPEGWKRTKTRTQAAFGKTTAVEGGRSALKRLSVGDSTGGSEEEFSRIVQARDAAMLEVAS